MTQVQARDSVAIAKAIFIMTFLLGNSHARAICSIEYIYNQEIVRDCGFLIFLSIQQNCRIYYNKVCSYNNVGPLSASGCLTLSPATDLGYHYRQSDDFLPPDSCKPNLSHGIAIHDTHG